MSGASNLPARLVALVLAGATAWLLFRLFEWRSVYYPTKRLDYSPAAFGLPYENVEFVAEDGVRLHGWWLPAEGARATLLFCHGNAGNIGDRVPLLPRLMALGANVFIFDYRGYGKSNGIPTEKGTYRDARAAFECVRARHDDAEDPPVIVLGRSLGGAVAVQLAVDKPVRGLIVESAFTSTADMARRIYPGLPLAPFLRYRYDSLAKIRGIAAPKLFAHSPRDEVVPYELGRRLFDAAPGPKEFVDLEGGHNEAGWESTPAYFEAMQRLLAQLGLAGHPPSLQ